MFVQRKKKKTGTWTGVLAVCLILFALLFGYRLLGEPLGGLMDVPWPSQVKPYAQAVDRVLPDRQDAEAFLSLASGVVEKGTSGAAELAAKTASSVLQTVGDLGRRIASALPGQAGGDAVSGTLEIHFLDVGQADAAVVLCGGKSLMIDGGNAADSRFVYSYLKNTLGLATLDVVIATHPHEDHIGGLSGALNACPASVVYSPVTEYDSKVFRNLLKYSPGLTVPRVGDTFRLGEATVTFLGPLRTDYEDENNLSIVVRIAFGGTSFLFTGDMEQEAETDLVNSGAALQSTLLKVGHHGSSSSTGYVFLREVMPEYAVISVGAGNKYGHPTETVLSRLRDEGAEVYRTDERGTIVCKSDGKKLTFTCEK